MPFYMSPEQVMKDKSDYARKGIARGRSVLTLTYADGILFVGENPSNALHKISEIYDRIAFAAVGKYNEFENLRLAGVRYADLRGYQYDRATSPAAAWPTPTPRRSAPSSPSPPSPTRSRSSSPRWATAADDQLYRLTYDGSVADEHGFVVMGGNSEPIATYVREHHDPAASLEQALQLAVAALVQPTPENRRAPYPVGRQPRGPPSSTARDRDGRSRASSEPDSSVCSARRALHEVPHHAHPRRPRPRRLLVACGSEEDDPTLTQPSPSAETTSAVPTRLRPRRPSPSRARAGRRRPSPRRVR
jgi:proteasome alpha subunit